MLVGLGAPVMNIPITDALIREVDIRGIFRYQNWWVANILIITLVVIVFVILFSAILVLLYSFFLSFFMHAL